MNNNPFRTASNAEAVLSFLRDRGVLESESITPQQVEEKKLKQAYHNTLLLLTNYLADNQSILTLGDQDVFNGLLYRHFYIAAPDHLYNFSARFIKTENKRFVDRNVRVIHYAGDEKPWKKNFPFHGFFLWWKYAWNTAPEFRAVFPAALLTHPPAKLRKSLVTRLSLLEQRFMLFSKRILPGPYFFLKRIYDKAGGKRR